MPLPDWENQKRILFLGDSITDAQRLERPYAPLGNGYVYFAASFLQARFPHLEFQIENRGVSGDTSRELLHRWRRDCLDWKPDVASILIGINDLWRRYKPVLDPQKSPVSAEEYEDNLRRMLTESLCKGIRFILMEPFFFCRDCREPMRRDLDDYRNAVYRLSGEFGTILVPLQQAYEQIKHLVADSRWSEDGVHPSTWAHAWIARQWLSAVAGE